MTKKVELTEDQKLEKAVQVLGKYVEVRLEVRKTIFKYLLQNLEKVDSKNHQRKIKEFPGDFSESALLGLYNQVHSKS